MPIDSTQYAALSAMITPALFMTATGSLIISTSNRISRIVDRVRVLNDLADALSRGASSLDFPAERLAHIAEQIHRLELRSDRVRTALTLLYLGFASFVGTSLALGLDVLIGNRLPAVPTALALLGVLLLIAACFHLTREGHAALRGNRWESSFCRELHERRVKQRESGA